jgi:NitT/TauT family transport system substrate-binding protein
VGGDKSFLEGLDRDKVATELVDYNYVKSACDKYPEWMNDPSVNESDPYEREEVFAI